MNYQKNIEDFLKTLIPRLSVLQEIALLYDNLKENGIVDLGKNACKIYGYEKTEKVGKYYKLCIILEYIDGSTLCDYASTTEYNTYQVRDWLKGICNSLKTMYQKDFLHLSIGIGNIKIRKSDNSAVLYDYERANYKGLIEALRKIRQENYNKSLHDDLNDERGREFSAVPHMKMVNIMIFFIYVY